LFCNFKLFDVILIFSIEFLYFCNVDVTKKRKKKKRKEKI